HRGPLWGLAKATFLEGVIFTPYKFGEENTGKGTVKYGLMLVALLSAIVFLRRINHYFFISCHMFKHMNF
ncbi:hypothetical protein ED312_21025, partial [Sinomicrobium pectinilyticum]